MPNVAEECTKLSSWFIAGWPILFILTFFAFSGGYIINGLARAASNRWREDDEDPPH
jgi:hypothetical protein